MLGKERLGWEVIILALDGMRGRELLWRYDVVRIMELLRVLVLDGVVTLRCIVLCVVCLSLELSPAERVRSVATYEYIYFNSTWPVLNCCWSL